MSWTPGRIPLALTLVLTIGCSSRWAPVALPAPEIATWNGPGGPLRVVRFPAETLLTEVAFLRNDTLWFGPLDRPRIPIPRSAMISLERRNSPGGRWVMIYLAVALTVGLLTGSLGGPGDMSGL